MAVILSHTALLVVVLHSVRAFVFVRPVLLCKQYWSRGACCLRGLTLRLWDAARWQVPYGNTTVGLAVLDSRGLFKEDWWRWVGIGVLLGYAILFNVLVLLAQTFLGREFLAPSEAPQDNASLKPSLSLAEHLKCVQRGLWRRSVETCVRQAGIASRPERLLHQRTCAGCVPQE